MAYNVGEKPGEGSYLCPNCGCRVGEMTMLAWQSTDIVKSSGPHLAKLKSVTLILILACLMFASGFATKTLLLTGSPSARPGSSANPSSGDNSQNVNIGNVSVSSADASTSVGNPGVTVWVNTNSGVYHCSNTRWYGNTKSGKYMTQKEAQSKGYRPAHGSVCG